MIALLIAMGVWFLAGIPVALGVGQLARRNGSNMVRDLRYSPDGRLEDIWPD